MNSSKNKLKSKKNWLFKPMPNTTLIDMQVRLLQGHVILLDSLVLVYQLNFNLLRV